MEAGVRDAHPNLHARVAGPRADGDGCLDDVDAFIRAAGEQRHLTPACSRLLTHMLTRMLRALPGRLQDDPNDYRARLLHPQAYFNHVGEGRGTSLQKVDRGRWTPSSSNAYL